jgi:hypothetical protein
MGSRIARAFYSARASRVIAPEAQALLETHGGGAVAAATVAWPPSGDLRMGHESSALDVDGNGSAGEVARFDRRASAFV